jgi:hypothetical protein
LTVRVHVEHIVDARRRIVACATALGPLQVVWEGDSLPDQGDHDVELDVPSILEWGYEIWRAGDEHPPGDADRTVLTGTMLGFDESGVAEIQLREGLLLVETLGEPPLGAVGGAVELRPPRIHAHPYEL